MRCCLVVLGLVEGAPNRLGRPPVKVEAGVTRAALAEEVEEVAEAPRDGEDGDVAEERRLDLQADVAELVGVVRVREVGRPVKDNRAVRVAHFGAVHIAVDLEAVPAEEHKDVHRPEDHDAHDPHAGDHLERPRLHIVVQAAQRRVAHALVFGRVRRSRDAQRGASRGMHRVEGRGVVRRPLLLLGEQRA